MLRAQLVFVFTVSCQRHSELIPGRQEDSDVLLIPGFERNCTHAQEKGKTESNAFSSEAPACGRHFALLKILNHCLLPG